MNDGRVEQIGTQPELYDRPANLFVATFTGSPAMNILPGRVTDGGIFVAGVANVAIKANISAGTKISYGLPPDDVVIGGEGNLPAEVVVVEPTGAETHIIARLGGHEITIVSRAV